MRRWSPISYREGTHGRPFVNLFLRGPEKALQGLSRLAAAEGIIEGACAALGLPIRFVTPPSWRRAVGIPPGNGGAKDAARSEAIRRWPDKAALFARVRDDGRAEAALVAVAGLMREGRHV